MIIADTPSRPRLWSFLSSRLNGASRRRLSGRDALSLASVATGPLLEETRRDLFAGLRAIADPHGLHVAPEVSLGALFTIHGRGDEMSTALRALRHKRVDFVLLDGAAQPVVAIDCVAGGQWRNRAIRRDQLKRDVFHKAGLPLLELFGGDALEADMAHVEAILTDIARTAASPKRPDRRAA
ncbi:DUF2726 domain-containing protein [Jannaschia sp. S6380]|uniref:DUF2726 domain-containing protein n=1 Tax=Jannaschia sp. S6380 TaxID=2926408 RepID=UPI001FF62D70|nr:DUF2726 domain-containing protein [Jannaschia sp. S6380]MCK0167508.1 DUF2726 domain-containing protein [Jannaschia sp. S6380]